MISTTVLDGALVTEEEWQKASAEKRKFDAVPEETDVDISEALATFYHMPDPLFGGEAAANYMVVQEEDSEEDSEEEEAGEASSDEE